MTLRPEHFRSVPDWPKQGILFYDIQPLLRSPQLLELASRRLIEAARELVGDVDFVIAPEARGFIFGPSLAIGLGAGFIPARKPDKLPPDTISVDYELEYGAEQLHIHGQGNDGARVLIHDDVLATGGTALALAQLVHASGAAVVGAAFLSQVAGLGGREALGAIPATVLVDLGEKGEEETISK